MPTLEGWALKRGTHRGWNNRYFVLKSNVLSYYDKSSDADHDPKGQLFLTKASYEISNVYIQEQKERKSGSKEVLYCIKLTRMDEPDAAIGIGTGNGTGVHSEPTSAEFLTSSKEDDLKSSLFSSERNHKNPLNHRPPTVTRSKSYGDSGGGSWTSQQQSTYESLRSPVGDLPSNDIYSSPKRRRSVQKHADGNPKTATSIVNDRSNPIDDPLDDLIPTQHSDDGQAELQEKERMRATYRAVKKEKKMKRSKKLLKGSKIVVAAGVTITVGALTAGVGLLAGMVFLGVGAAAGGTGVAAEKGLHFKKRSKDSKELIVALTDFEEAKRWKSALDACLASELVKDSTWGQMFALEGRNTASLLFPTKDVVGISSRDDDTSQRERRRKPLHEETNSSELSIQWKPLDGGWAIWLSTGVNGIRMFREEIKAPCIIEQSIERRQCPPLKGQLVLNASPLNAFLCLMSHNRCTSPGAFPVPNSGQRAAFRVIESIDDHADVIHLVFRPIFLFPSWTKSRDFVLYRYWRLQDDGSYLVCYDSVHHDECLPCPKHVRGEFYGAYTIAPKKNTLGNFGSCRQAIGERNECLVSAVVQVKPRGWVPNFTLPLLSNQGYGEAFTVTTLLQILDIQDALDQERFVSTPLDMPSNNSNTQQHSIPIVSSFRKVAQSTVGVSPSKLELNNLDINNSFGNYDFEPSKQDVTKEDSLQEFATKPPPLPHHFWDLPDANSFYVRGKHYKNDKKKFNAGPSMGRLVAVDFVRVDKNIFTGFCPHPTERLQLALERERRLKAEGSPSDLPPYFFVVNIAIPGFHMVFYYAMDDMSTIDGSNDTPESKLANEFFFGSSDKMRDLTFKLIPRIVVGNFMVRRAVGSTPAIMGKQLRQLYIKGDRFFEVILDCGSSAVATGCIRLCLGYAETLVVDMGFLLEGNDESTLPEKIFGCVRIKHAVFGQNQRLVKPPPSVSAN